ncbi:hypothetical protein GGX14DRAFT_555470 [Mycena pura]|uniref:Uncharacterized protein n=1 Tax=Mycena pura TaxID=153505 RepID=A0AAD7E3K1_9AGAR|nr:hypothetical protein GGX14DRAFT_555470 [Mycena pura]
MLEYGGMLQSRSLSALLPFGYTGHLRLCSVVTDVTLSAVPLRYHRPLSFRILIHARISGSTSRRHVITAIYSYRRLSLKSSDCPSALGYHPHFCAIFGDHSAPLITHSIAPLSPAPRVFVFGYQSSPTRTSRSHQSLCSHILLLHPFVACLVLPLANTTSSSEGYARTIAVLVPGLWPSWEPQIKSELMRHGLWRICTGEEIALPAPTAPVFNADDSPATRSFASREYKYEVREHNEALRRNDRAIGLIRTYIAEDQLRHLDGRTSAKDVWDTLREQHKP